MTREGGRAAIAVVGRRRREEEEEEEEEGVNCQNGQSYRAAGCHRRAKQHRQTPKDADPESAVDRSVAVL